MMLLSPLTVMSLLSMAVVPEERRAFRQRFQRAKMDSGEFGPVDEFLGGQTPICVVTNSTVPQK
jgi:hypothetical protein